jgi:hypothetical protein
MADAEFNLLAFLQGFEAFAFNGREMAKDIRAVFLGNEAIAFFSSNHLTMPRILKTIPPLVCSSLSMPCPVVPHPVSLKITTI